MIHPFIELRRAIKRNAEFESREVKDAVISLIDSLERDLTKDVLANEDDVVTYSSDTEKCLVDLKSTLKSYETSSEESEEEDDE